MSWPDHARHAGGVLVTDFDGTLTRRDFYRLVIDELLPPGTPDFWAEYLAGEITHFEAIRKTFAAAPAGEAALLGAGAEDGARARPLGRGRAASEGGLARRRRLGRVPLVYPDVAR